MEFVKHHVKASGSKSLRGFFASENVDYDPPSLSLRQNIMKAKCRFVYSLASGPTDEDEERAIRDVMQKSENSYELIRMTFAMGGWAGLDDELDEAYLDQIAKRLAEVLDQRNYVVYDLIRRHLPILDYSSSPNLGDCFLKILQLPVKFQKAELGAILNKRAEILNDVASATLRNRTKMVDAARIVTDVITAFDNAAPHREDDLIRLMHQINYTRRICISLEMLRYDGLYDVILDLADPKIKDVRQRQACYDAVLGLSLEFAAAEGAVKYAGSNEAKSTVGRFMVARQTALDAFTPAAPPNNILTALAAVLAPAATTLAALKTAILNLPDTLTASLTLPSLLGSSQDDNARYLINEANAQGWLPHMATRVKVQAVNGCLGGGGLIPGVESEEEIAINTLLSAAKDRDQAELYQLVASASWEELSSAIDGAEYDQLENILSQPT